MGMKDALWNGYWMFNKKMSPAGVERGRLRERHGFSSVVREASLMVEGKTEMRVWQMRNKLLRI